MARRAFLPPCGKTKGGVCSIATASATSAVQVGVVLTRIRGSIEQRQLGEGAHRRGAHKPPRRMVCSELRPAE